MNGGRRGRAAGCKVVPGERKGPLRQRGSASVPTRYIYSVLRGRHRSSTEAPAAALARPCSAAGLSWLIVVTSSPPARHEDPARAFPPPRAGHPAPARTREYPTPRHPHVSAAAPVPVAVGPDIAASTRRRRAAVMTPWRRRAVRPLAYRRRWWRRPARWRGRRPRRRGLRVRGEGQATGAGGAGHGNGSKEIATMHRETPEGSGSPPDRASLATLARRYARSMTAVVTNVTLDGRPPSMDGVCARENVFSRRRCRKCTKLGMKKVFITGSAFLAGCLMLFLCNRQDGDIKECLPRACQKSAVKRPKKQVKTKA